MFLKNHWYAVAWDHELKRTAFGTHGLRRTHCACTDKFPAHFPPSKIAVPIACYHFPRAT